MHIIKSVGFRCVNNLTFLLNNSRKNQKKRKKSFCWKPGRPCKAVMTDNESQADLEYLLSLEQNGEQQDSSENMIQTTPATSEHELGTQAATPVEIRLCSVCSRAVCSFTYCQTISMKPIFFYSSRTTGRFCRCSILWRAPLARFPIFRW